MATPNLTPETPDFFPEAEGVDQDLAAETAEAMAEDLTEDQPSLQDLFDPEETEARTKAAHKTGIKKEDLERILRGEQTPPPQEEGQRSTPPASQKEAKPKLPTTGPELRAALWQWARETQRVSFGKYEGETWDDVPKDYVNWVCTNFENGLLRDRALTELLLRGEAKVDAAGTVTLGNRETRPLSPLGMSKLTANAAENTEEEAPEGMPFSDQTAHQTAPPPIETREQRAQAARGAAHTKEFHQALARAFSADLTILSNTLKNFPGGPYAALLVALINDPSAETEKRDEKTLCIKIGGHTLTAEHGINGGGQGWRWTSITQEAKVERADDQMVA